LGKIKIEQYVHYQRYGYLIMPGLLPAQDTDDLANMADDLLYGREVLNGMDPVKPDATLEELLSRFTRIHMIHRVHPTAEAGLLNSQIVDVLAGLIGPDVLALQSMLFFNPPGKGGQGWHQDSLYIDTYPDTLIGAWIALEDADEENGCLWVVPGSNHEPVYMNDSPGHRIHDEDEFEDLFSAKGASNIDDEVNAYTAVVRKYPAPISVPLKKGDVLFFNSRLLHRSYPNRTKDRFRRSYVCHYCNARSFVPWNHGVAFEGDSANREHILARGATHLEHGSPIFGTKVNVKIMNKNVSSAPERNMGMEDEGMMVVQPFKDNEIPS